LELDVDPVCERTRYSAPVARDALRRATAATGAIAAMPARAGIHGGDKLEARRELRLVRGARNRNSAGLERLSQRFQHVAVELRQLVEEQHTVMRERDFARARQGAAADQSGSRGAVVRRPKWPLAPPDRLEAAARYRMDRGDFEGVGLRKDRQDA